MRFEFHVARANPLHEIIAQAPDVMMIVWGPDAYISPDWYVTPEQVPTWNYVAVEASGRAQRLDETESLAHLTRLATEQESYLAPKPAWTPARVPERNLKQLLLGIVPFRLPLDTLEGKAKLSQNRSQTDIAGVIAALGSRGDEAGDAIASAMQTLSVR